MNMDLIHTHSLETSAALSIMQGATTLPLLAVISVLNDARVQFVLIGTHGLAGWMRKPRATQDVDVVVSERHLNKATGALVRAFPNLEPRDAEVVIRFHNRVSNVSEIDIVKPRAVYRNIFKHTNPVSVGGQSFRIPCLEMALAMKFAAMATRNPADAEQYQDAHDFIRMVKGNPELNQTKLVELGELVYGGGAAAALLEMIRKVRAGERLLL